MTHVFASWPGSDPLSRNNVPSTVNVSLVNYLIHHVGRDIATNGFENTRFKSDVHVADCTYYINTVDGGKVIEDQAMIPAGFMINAASGLDSVGFPA